eukprot:scaffold40233_cov191-Amphora_coffeaeformis.AAC.1
MNEFLHPKRIINNKKEAPKFTEDDLVAMGAMYLKDQASRQPNCICISKRTAKACQCMRRFDGLPYEYCVGVARYMVHFAKKSKFDQQLTIIQWIQYAEMEEKGACKYIVPLMSSKAMKDALFAVVDTPDISCLLFKGVCNSCLMTILGYGQTAWNTVYKHAMQGTVPHHGLLGKGSNNSSNKSVIMELHYFFADLELHAAPTPMRFIREKTGTLHERDKKEIKLLPPYFTKRSLYQRYCYGQGWEVSTNCRGSPNKKKERGDVEWTVLGQECGEIVSWTTFREFWNTHYADLAVGKPSEDTCSICHKYCIQLKFNNARNSCETEGIDSDDEGQITNNINEQEEPAGELLEVVPGQSSLIEVPLQVEETELIILHAEKHVKDAKAMREYANMKMNEARHSTINDEWSVIKDCLVADYCQNLSLPHTGMTQPGDTYYFSPLTVNCFGTADAGYELPKMRAYVYNEGEGAKGGNNIASLLYKDIQDRGWVDANKGTRGELTLIMDNCSGQNKNKMVLRMLSFLVELKLYKRINVSFLVAGHTKNICDRLFNLLKLNYRQSNVYCAAQLLQVLNTSADVTAVGVDHTHFYDWDAFEDTIYRKIKSGTVTRTHLFEFDASRPGVLVTKDTVLADSFGSEQNLVKKMVKETRAACMENYKSFLKVLKPPGIKPIKQYELWHKWRPFVPEQFQDI